MRDLDWDGSRNIRDLGGLATPLSSTGRTISRRVARGPRRELLTRTGWAAAHEWGLRSIVDLRNASEVGPQGDDPHVEPVDVTITLAPTEDHTNAEFRAVCFPILDSPEYWQHNVRILPGHLRTTLGTIAASRAGILVHCGAGRDRTGMISALLLAHAGVSADDIVADHAASVRAMAGTTALTPTQDRQAAWGPVEVDAYLAEVASHIRAFIADTDQVLDQLDVHGDTRQELRNLLVTPDRSTDPR